MYVSPDIIFVHVPRCGGTSVRNVLADGRKPRDFVITDMHAHAFGREICKAVGLKTWQRAWTFALVRNPWDRLISLFHLCLSPRDDGTPYTRLARGLPKAQQERAPELHREIEARGFAWWLTEFCERFGWNPWQFDFTGRPVTRIQASEWVFDADDKSLVDTVYKLETDLPALVATLRAQGFERPLPRLKGTEARRATETYFDTRATRRFVERWFARDLEAFDYAI